MARTRDLKPGFFKNEILASLPPLTRIFYEGLWCWADREGRLEDRPAKWKAEILAYDNVDGEEMMASLAEKRFVTRYEVDGIRYVQVNTFKKHQTGIHPNEQASIIPPPPDKSPASNLQAGELSPTCNAIPSLPSLSSLPSRSTNILSAGKPGGRVRKKVSNDPSPEFEEFYATYPRPEGRLTAWRQWQKRLKDGHIAADMITGAKNYAGSCAGKEREHIKLPATFIGPDLHFREWLKAPPSPKPRTPKFDPGETERRLKAGLEREASRDSPATPAQVEAFVSGLAKMPEEA